MAASSLEESTSSDTPGPEPTRHDKYYYKDGDCVFKVETHIFRLHRFILTRNSAVFEKMLSQKLRRSPMRRKERKAVVNTSTRGCSDYAPIICDDSLEAFRSLCWGLYATPTEIRAQDDLKTADIGTLIHLTSISRKYEFTSLHSWAAGILSAHCTRKDAGSTTFISSLSQGDLEQLLLLFWECDCIDAQQGVAEEWLSRIPKYLENPQAFRRSLDYVETWLGCHIFLARVYYHSLRAMMKFGLGSSTELEGTQNSFKTFSANPVLDNIMSALSVDQTLRLYRGLWALLSLEQQLQGVPWFKRASTCTVDHVHAGTCLELWRSLWKETGECGDGKCIDPASHIARALSTLIEDRSQPAKLEAPCYESMELELKSLQQGFYSKLFKLKYFALPYKVKAVEQDLGEDLEVPR